MLKDFKGTYEGFQSKRRVGEVFDYENKKWVIIHILNTRVVISGNPIIETNIVAQRVGKDIDYSQFYSEYTITDRLSIEGRTPWDKNIKKIGELINLSTEQGNEKIPAMVKGIESFEYEYTDLIVRYQVELIKPWSNDQMNKAIQANRLSTFKVFSGKEK